MPHDLQRSYLRPNLINSSVNRSGKVTVEGVVCFYTPALWQMADEGKIKPVLSKWALARLHVSELFVSLCSRSLHHLSCSMSGNHKVIVHRLLTLGSSPGFFTGLTPPILRMSVCFTSLGFQAQSLHSLESHSAGSHSLWTLLLHLCCWQGPPSAIWHVPWPNMERVKDELSWITTSLETRGSTWGQEPNRIIWRFMLFIRCVNSKFLPLQRI